MNIVELLMFFNYNYEPEEQAFIQLSGKEERGIRDKVASSMHLKGKQVKREFTLPSGQTRSQIDLAVYNEADEVTDLIEFKLYYSWDLVWDHFFQTGRIGRHIEKDFQKLIHSKLECSKFIVVSVIHPKRSQPFSDNDIKYLPKSYFRDLNKYIQTKGTDELDIESCTNKINARLSHFYSEIVHIEHKLGTYRECAVDLHHWIMKI